MITIERLKELREWAVDQDFGDGISTDLLAVLDEVERLRDETVIQHGALKTLSGVEELWIKAEAELSHAKEVAEGAGYRLANAEAKFARVRPLVEAAMGADISMRKTYIEGEVCRDENCPLLRAALDYRNAENEKKGDPQMTPPTAPTREEMLKLWDDCYAIASTHLYGAPKYGPHYDAIRALIEASAQAPAPPLPAEVEEAMALLAEAKHAAYLWRRGYEGLPDAIKKHDAEDVALATLRAAFQPKVVSREQIQQRADAFGCLSVTDVVGILRDQGVKVEETLGARR